MIIYIFKVFVWNRPIEKRTRSAIFSFLKNHYSLKQPCLMQGFYARGIGRQKRKAVSHNPFLMAEPKWPYINKMN